MDRMRDALERAKMLVGMEVDEEAALPPPEEQSFFDDINRHCTLNTTQAISRLLLLPPLPPAFPCSLTLGSEASAPRSVRERIIEYDDAD
jgi:hypothetical protein